MNKFILLAGAVISTALSSKAQLQLPQPSPKAMVMQTIGYTDITVDYSSPAVKGRLIWGELVPYNNIWRAGANSATKVTFSKDVTVNGANVPKGSYSIFIIPTKALWTVILNKDATASADQYKQENDQLRVEVAPQSNPFRERLAYTITDFTHEKGTLSMEWEKMKVSLLVECPTEKQAVEAIDKAVGATWQIYNNAARYYLDHKDYDKALGYANQSIALSEQWFNHWVKAQIMSGKGDQKSAYMLAMKAKEMGDKNPQGFFFKNDVEKAIIEWKPADGKKK